MPLPPPYILLLFSLPSAALALSPQVVPLSVRTNISGISDWINVLTLCLAPLASHIVFGLAEPVVLAGKHPPWTERLPLFNPVSIIWRYFAITDRRIRAKCWDRADMAACNAAFWDGERWDGSEEVMVASRRLLTKLPTRSHVLIVSGSTIATLTMALQGVQAITMIVNGATLLVGSHIDGLPALFSFLAIMGFSRLGPALWLSNEYGYTDGGEPGKQSPMGTHGYLPVVDDTDREPSEVTREMISKRLHPVLHWRGILFRAIGFLTALVTIGLSIMSMLRGIVWQFPGDPDNRPLSVSSILMTAMYLPLVLGTLIIHTAYIASGSTVLPCVQSLWYKLYTYVLILLASLAFVAGAFETRVITCSPLCGKYTYLPKEFDGCS
ncbi:hypothetical protein GP486_001160 [Trichoglossum hirsutum]|uniref:Uncharacterized protein n=1 Tax=Trichoglossum hirsutum TaxID=265104 RepID=A0A9P8RTD0_9PEZI|nr:hypothetical protein GP486_001160 [Trichoglossum hirsutum]